jgi:hypothetical protein
MRWGLHPKISRRNGSGTHTNCIPVWGRANRITPKGRQPSQKLLRNHSCFVEGQFPSRGSVIPTARHLPCIYLLDKHFNRNWTFSFSIINFWRLKALGRHVATQKAATGSRGKRIASRNPLQWATQSISPQLALFVHFLRKILEVWNDVFLLLTALP